MLKALVFFALFVGILGNRKWGHLDYCGVSAKTLPPPTVNFDSPPNAELKQVQVVIRHGDRVSWSGNGCWNNDTGSWPCGITEYSYDLSKTDPVLPTHVFRRVNMAERDVIPGTCFVGQLTDKGHEQEHWNGNFLNRRYVKSGFLSNDPDPSTLFFRSDDEHRTIHSLQSLIYTMLPDYSRKVFDIYMMDLATDNITPNEKLCPKFTDIENECRQTPEYRKYTDLYITPLLKKLSGLFYGDPNKDIPGGLSNCLDCFNTHLCHNLEVPDWLDLELYNEVMKQATIDMIQPYLYPNRYTASSVGIGFLLKDIITRMSEEDKKFVIYSGHDTTLLPMLVALDIFDGKWPRYASTIIFELFEVKNVGQAVRLLYNGNYVKLPGCDNILCPYDQFEKIISSLSQPGLC